MKKYHLLFLIFLSTLAALLLGWLAVQNFPFYGVKVVRAELGESTPLISSLGPEVRTRLGDGHEAILESPVYFDVRIMPWFSRADVYIIYEEVGQHSLVGVGRQTGPGFNYQLHQPLSVRALADGTFLAIFEFDLNNSYQQKNVYRFLVDTSRHVYLPGNELRIKELKVFMRR